MDIADAPAGPLSTDAFLAWAREAGAERVELVDGDIVAMAPETLRHVKVKQNTAEALGRAIRDAGVACTAFGDGATVRVEDHSAYIPDAVVTCGPVDLDGTEIPAPVIVVEVLSTSTRGTDMGRKLSGYFTLPSLRHYLMIDPHKRLVIHHARDDAGVITMRFLREGALMLDPPGLSFPVEMLFTP